MKKSFKFLLSFLFLQLLVFGAFAEGYHVCVASYKNLKNAETMLQKLENQSIAAFINENKVKNESYYRILLSKEFKKIEDARKYRDEVQKYSFVRELGLKGFWVCQGDKNLAPKSSSVKKNTVAPKKEKQKPAPAPLPKAKETPKPAPKTEQAKSVAPAPVVEPPKEVVPEPLVKEVAPAPIPEPPVQEQKNSAQDEANAPIILVPAEIPQAEPANGLENDSPVKDEPVPSAKDENANTLGNNEDSVLSREKPYSVAVRSYKYRQFAENDKERLQAMGYNSYVLNTFDNRSFFSFNLHAGAFATAQEAMELQSKLRSQGIYDTEISDYNKEWTKMQKYDDIIESEKITFDNGLSEFPTNVSYPVDLVLRNFPANKNFQIDEFAVLDNDKYKESAEKPTTFDKIHGYIGSDDAVVHAAVLATYYDALMEQGVTVFLANADEYTFGTADNGTLESFKLRVGNAVFDSTLHKAGDEFVLHGSDLSNKLFLTIKSIDFTKEQFVNFLTDTFSGASLTIYPQLRKTLFVLPDASMNVYREFIGFNFNKIGDSYAITRNNADWALAIVGHCLSRAVLQEKNSLVNVEFYDLDYDFNAKQVHSKFIETKKAVNSVENDRNHALSVQGADGWYLVNEEQKELSFTTKTYVISVDVNNESPLQKNDLLELAADLKIWDSDNSKNRIDAK